VIAPATDLGRAGLTALLADPGSALVAVDYDGTLAPVVARPEDAVPAPGAVDALARLAGRVGRLALVTGRPADVVVRLGGLDAVPGLQVLGQYGAQRWSGGALETPPELPGVARARAALPALAAAEGAHVEDKGISLVVHTRTAPDPAGALVRLHGPVAELAAGAGLELHPGRLVLELRPPGFDKGGALLSLCAPRPSAVLFAGDDRGDLPAFDAVDRLRADGVPGLLVCSGSDEGPAELRERADLVVDGPAGVVEVLRGLAG
jgi:trehalose 6-phosphate phosphatase